MLCIEKIPWKSDVKKLLKRNVEYETIDYIYIL